MRQLAFLTMLSLLAAALLMAGTPHRTSPSLLVCWGNDGGIPAVALEDGGEPLVLLPGSDTDARFLAHELSAEGQKAIATLFMPTGAPFPRGAQSLANSLPIRQVVVGADSRSRLDWQPLQQQLAAAGTSIQSLEPAEGRCWTAMLGDWRLTYRKLPDSAFRCELTSAAGPDHGPSAAFELRVTGEFLVGPLDGAPWAIFPKTNCAGSRRFLLPPAAASSTEPAK